MIDKRIEWAQIKDGQEIVKNDDETITARKVRRTFIKQLFFQEVDLEVCKNHIIGSSLIAGGGVTEKHEQLVALLEDGHEMLIATRLVGKPWTRN